MNLENVTIDNRDDNSFTILTRDDRGWTGQRFGCDGRLRTYAVGPFPTREEAFNAIIWTPDLERDETRQGPHGARRHTETSPIEDTYETDMSQIIADLTWMPDNELQDEIDEIDDRTLRYAR